MEQFEFGRETVWQPTADYMARSHLKRFMDRHGITTFSELLERSTEDLEWFWNAPSPGIAAVVVDEQAVEEIRKAV